MTSVERMAMEAGFARKKSAGATLATLESGAITRRKDLPPSARYRSALGGRRVLLGLNLREVTESNVPADSIRYTSINKAKGLDARAVILLGLPPFAECDDDFTAYTWFMGASRARQLLAVVEVCAGDE
jgi:hypothetical protein